MTLEAVRLSLFSNDYEVLGNGESVAYLDLAWFREGGELVVRGERFRIGRRGLLGAFYLERDGETIASATKPSVFHRSYEVELDSEVFTLAAVSPVHRSFQLLDGSTEIGRVAPAHLFSRKAVAKLPERLSLERRVFLVWLVLVLWGRAETAS